jgi:hypothetical protein
MLATISGENQEANAIEARAREAVPILLLSFIIMDANFTQPKALLTT